MNTRINPPKSPLKVGTLNENYSMYTTVDLLCYEGQATVYKNLASTRFQAVYECDRFHLVSREQTELQSSVKDLDYLLNHIGDNGTDEVKSFLPKRKEL